MNDTFSKLGGQWRAAIIKGVTVTSGAANIKDNTNKQYEIGTSGELCKCILCLDQGRLPYFFAPPFR